MDSSTTFGSAVWIASPLVGSKRTMAPVPFLRKSFRLDQPIKTARLAITALGLYQCEINGKRVGDEVFAPGWTDYHHRVQFQTFDVGPLLSQGENVLGAILGDGWYCGFVGWVGRQQYGDRPRLLACLEVTFADGSRATIATDSSWKTTIGPILESDLQMGESYDARLELGAWSQAGYDEARWQSVLVSPPEHAVNLVPRVGPPVRRMGELRPVKDTSRKTWNESLQIFDFGQNFSGRVRIRIKSPGKGINVRLRFAEVLNPDGSVYLENLRSARCTDYYTCAGTDEITWEPLFTFHGFRYVELENVPRENILEVTGIVLHSDTRPSGTFRCSHEGLNQLQHNIVWGQKSNFLEVPTDCPQRDERLGWTGDAQVFVRTAAFNMDVRGFFQKWMQDHRDSQGPTGAIPCVVPEPPGGKFPHDGGPAWSDATIICPWTIYLCYADRQILADHYEAMQRFMVNMAKERCAGLIRNHPDTKAHAFGDWLALDGGGQTVGITPSDLIGTAFYAYDAELMAMIAEILDRPEDAKAYRALHAEIAQAFRHRFVTPEGLVVSGTQTSYVLALHFGLVEESARGTTMREFAQKIEKQGNHLGTGFVGTPYVLDVLEKGGRLDLAYTLLEQETFPSWLFPIRNGATTIWERWDGWTPEKGFQDKGMNSFNHYAYGAVGDWMYHTVAGLELDPKEPGYAHIIFRPRPGGSITWAEATLQTAFGLAGIRWDLEGDGLQVQLTVPTGARATFQPPPGYGASESTYTEGSHRVKLKKA